MLAGISRVLGPSIWSNTILCFSRASEGAAPPGVGFDDFVDQRATQLRTAIEQVCVWGVHSTAGEAHSRKASLWPEAQCGGGAAGAQHGGRTMRAQEEHSLPYAAVQPPAVLGERGRPPLCCCAMGPGPQLNPRTRTGALPRPPWLAQVGGQEAELPVALLENSSRCPVNEAGEKVVPNGAPWVVDLLRQVGPLGHGGGQAGDAGQQAQAVCARAAGGRPRQAGRCSGVAWGGREAGRRHVMQEEAGAPLDTC